jgi:hypothetical protein
VGSFVVDGWLGEVGVVKWSAADVVGWGHCGTRVIWVVLRWYGRSAVFWCWWLGVAVGDWFGVLAGWCVVVCGGVVPVVFATCGIGGWLVSGGCIVLLRLLVLVG